MTTSLKIPTTSSSRLRTSERYNLFNDNTASTHVKDQYTHIEERPTIREEIVSRIKDEVTVGRITVVESDDSLHIYTRSQKGLQLTKDVFRRLNEEYPEFKLIFRVIQSDKSIILKYRRHRVR